MLEELEKHLILNSNRLRTFEDARLEFATYVEAKFCLSVRDSKPSESGAGGHADPTNVDAISEILLHLITRNGKRSSSPQDGCTKCGGSQFQRDCNVHVTPRKCNGKKGKLCKSWSKSAGEGKIMEGKGGITSQGQGNPKVPKVRKVCARVTLRKLV